MATLEPTPVSQSLLDPCGDPDCDANNKAAKYKLYGEQSGRTNSDNSQLSVWDNKKAVRVALTKNTVSPKAFTANGGFASPANINTSATFYAKRPKEPQANIIQTLNALQSYRYGFGKRFATHPDCNNCSGDLGFYDSIGVKRYKIPAGTLNSQGIDKSEKVSEIIVTKNDGMRYGYGLPAMNQRQVNASFNVYPNGSGTGNAGKYTGGATPAVSSNVLNPDIISTSTNSVASHSSSNQYLNKTTLPKYAHSWLLTHVVSPDYSDRTGNGFSIDDPGSWMKFEYKKTASHYRWREPYIGLSFMQGNKADQRDDMAAYTFGTKELYYLHRIETATHLAVFETEDRNDGVEAKSELFGGLNNVSPRKMQRLKNIKLYVKPLDGTTLNITTATPIQTVVFGHAGYDNYPGTTTLIPQSLELCKGIPSAGGSGRGKLTLVTVHMTADKSIKGSLSPYKFTYATNTALVEGYNRLNKDRWGNFQYNSGLFGSWFSYVDFPYTSQVVGQQYANNWQLTQIQLPTGGLIDVTYESDDYAYEMDKPAAQMFDIIHTSTETTAPTTTTWTGLPTTNDRYASPATLASGNLGGTTSQGTYRLYLKLPRAIPSTVTDKNKYFKDNYLGTLSQIYFKTLCQLKNGSSKSERDYVAGYANLETTAANSYGVNNAGDLAFITLKGVDVQNPAFGQKIHPIRKASLEHLRANKPELVYGYNTAEGSPNNFKAQFKNIVGSIGNFFQEVSLMFGGFNRQAVASPRQWSNTIYFNGNSMVRLQSGEGAMFGGGIRVNKIAIRNQWDVIGGGVEDSYGQQYEYKIEENGRMISSGVAMTPPDMGGDECALLEPVNYTNSTPLISPFHLFVEKPIMRDYYPGASVGYRKVTVKGLASSTPTPAKDLSYAPITEHEFYTPKDFPVFESQTDLSGDQPIYELANFIIGSKMIKKTGRSQGYSVELNNMAGVMKSVTKRTYPTTANPSGTVISKIEHIYHTDPVHPNRLSSNVAIMKNNESMEMGVIGETYDIFHDFHENLQTARQVGLDLNVDIMSIFLPILTILPIPGFSQNTSSVRTAVTHKIIYRTGILKEVRATDGLSTVVTENLAFDKVTAQPVLTRVNNEFKDYIYSYSQPAYWYYNSPTTGSMAGAWENIGITGINTGAATAGVISGIAPADISNFVVGDEIWVNDPTDADAGFRAIVTQVGASSITCMRPQRQVANDATSIYPTWTGARVLTIFRSGKRNLLDAVAGNTTFRGTPGATSFAQIVGQFSSRNSNVLDVSTTTFKDAWDADYCNTYYNCGILPSAAPTTLCTPALEPGCQTQVQVPQPSNPYVTGSKGNWRVDESYVNKSKRAYKPDASEGSLPSLREYGTYVISPFTWAGTNGANWVRASKAIKYLLQGSSIEEQDAIGNYSATQFGYKRQLVTATCTNSEYREMAFDGFEDYPKDCSDHFKISYISPDNIVSATAHTGSKSIRVTNRDIGGTTSDYPYIIKSLAAPGAGCINSFSPIAVTSAPLRKYAISAWAKERLATNETQDIANARYYSKAAIRVSFTTLSGSNVGTPQVYKPFGELIEGWQRINGSFEVPIGAELIHIRLLNTSTGNVNTVFMDDIRIHPFNALMQSFVYDPTNLRLLATLDENNYATFYIRDQEGQPVKFNKETEKGIVTVKEGTKHVKQ
ncbi:MAG: hypothetical protein IPN76_03240 [Saprospiraceae bacterium]|nr:hypothetical protein [Saprospiraceae bacterium]